MDTTHEMLSKFGFTEVMTKIYLILAKKGKLDVGSISKEVDLSRTAVHEALNELMSRELLDFEKKGRHVFYTITHPNHLAGIIEQKKRDDALLFAKMEETMRQLVGPYNLAQNRPGVRFFEGRKEVKAIYEDTLLYKDPIYSFWSPKDFDPELKKWQFEDYNPRRVKKGVAAKVIVPKSQENRAYKEEDKKRLRETLTVPELPYGIDAECMVYGKDKVAFVSTKEENITGTLIQNPAIFTSIKTVFEMLWRFGG